MFPASLFTGHLGVGVPTPRSLTALARASARPQSADRHESGA